MISNVAYTANHHYRSQLMKQLYRVILPVAFASFIYHLYLGDYYVAGLKIVLVIGCVILQYTLPKIPLQKNIMFAVLFIYTILFASMLKIPSIGIWILTLPALSFAVIKKEHVLYADGFGLTLIILAYVIANWFDTTVFSLDMFLNLMAGYLVLSYVSLMFHKLIIQYRSDLSEVWAEKRKQQASRTLSAGIAHLINNQMTSIIGNASLLETLHGREQKFVKNINKSAFQTSKYVNDLLAYAEQSVASHDEYIDIKECIQESIAHIDELGKVSISFHIQDDVPLVVGNRQQLMSSVFENILVNALDSQPKSGIYIDIQHISVHGSSKLFSGTYVKVDISDDGEGMSADVVKQAFDPFYTTKFLGRGLGLAAAFGAVKRHQGLIELTSTQGEGTTCSVWFPIKLEQEDIIDDELWEF